MNDKKLEENYEELCTLIAKTSDKVLIKEFFNCLFTQKEITDWVKRWMLVKDINDGETQREIAKKYNMSLCKITRGSRELKKEGSAFMEFIKMRGRGREGR